MAGLTVLDASILIAYFDERDARNAAASQILAEASGLAASVITLGEALVEPARRGRLDEFSDALADLAIIPVPVAREAPITLARLRADTDLKMPDCCVLHAAQTIHADAIGTRDKSLSREARTRGLETP